MSKASNLLALLTILYLISSLAHPHTLLAGTTPISSDSPVTATIPSLAVSSDSQAPTSPVLVRPVDSTVTSDPILELVWRRSVDEGGNTVHYTAYIDGVATYLGISDLGNSSGVGYTARIDMNELKLLPTIPLSEGRHSWYVVAEDLSGNRRSSATWHFTIDRTPPILILESLEDIALPSLDNNPVFTFSGPQEIALTVKTEPYSTIFITFVNSSGSTVDTLSYTTSGSGVYQASYPLALGQYSVLISSLDRANLTSSLPTFSLELTSQSAPTNSSAPGAPSLSKPPDVTYLAPPLSLSSLPATIANASPRVRLAYGLTSLIAVISSYLLVLLWKRRFNLYLTDSNGEPLAKVKVYHRLPPYAATSHYPDARGRLSIPHLNRYSTLTLLPTGANSPLSGLRVVSLSVSLSVYHLSV